MYFADGFDLLEMRDNLSYKKNVVRPSVQAYLTGPNV